MGKLHKEPITLTITVSSGSGSAQFTEYGYINRLYFDAPTETADYDYLIADSEGRVIDTSPRTLAGDQLIKKHEQVYGRHTFWITNADEDGTWTVTLWTDDG